MKINKKNVSIELQNPYGYETLPTLENFELWCNLTIQKDHYHTNSEPLSVVIRVVDETESADLNKKYREKNGSTNILSFENHIDDLLLDIPELKQEKQHLGDLVICEPVLVKEAKIQEKSIASHWAHIVVHGTLHLQGFDHIEEDQAMLMESLEIRILETLGIDNPYLTA